MKYMARADRTVACFWRGIGGALCNLKTYSVEHQFLKKSANFPYAFDFSSEESGIDENDLEEIEDWCIKNLKGSCSIVLSKVFIGAKFDNKEDAIIFRMSWG